MRHAYLAILLSCIAAGCGDSSDPLSQGDDSCGGSGLQGLCGDDCPRRPADAEKKICGKAGPAYVVYDNDCGGKTVTDPDTADFMRMTGAVYLAGHSYFFDDDGKLVGGTMWSDALDPDCPFPPAFYGQECESTSDGEFHRCEVATDIGGS